jgi:tight adherence protein B
MVNLRRALATAFVALVALVAVAPAGAGASPNDAGIRIRRIDTSGYPTVAVTVSVPTTVNPDSIELTEGGHAAKVLAVRPLASAGEAVSVVLAFDTSDSVKGAPLAAAVAAAKTFVAKLPPGVQVGVLTFSDRVRILQPITAQHDAVLKAIGSIGNTVHGTVLYDSVRSAVGMFSGPAQRNVVLLTDGSDVGSSSTVQQAVASARGGRTAIFTVGLGSQADTPVLRTMAGDTGGTYTPAVESNLSAVYASLAAQLSNQYVIQYQSRAPEGAEITVAVNAGSLHDQSFIQMPRLPSPPSPGFDFFHFFAGPVGLISSVGLAFIAIFALTMLLVGGTLRSRRDRHLARMMAAASGDGSDDVTGEKQGPAGWIPDSLSNAAGWAAEVSGATPGMEELLERAGVPMTPGELVAGCILAATLAGLVAVLLFHNPLFVLLFALIAGFVPYMLVRRRRTKRIQEITDQLPDVLMILASSMRAGHSFLQALDAASQEVGGASAPEFARVVTEIRLGRPVTEALTALGERIGTEEYKWTVLAVNIQSEVGGNLAEILDTLAETVRERSALRRQIRVLSAEGRLSMRIFVLLPPALVLVLAKINPDYMKLLWTTTAGWIMIGCSIVLMIIGWALARKVVKIDV